MKTIGQVFDRIYQLQMVGEYHDDWHALDDKYRNVCEVGSKEVLLHALDMLHRAGVSPDVAASRLRRGETLEAICESDRLKATVEVEKDGTTHIMLERDGDVAY